MKRSDLLSTIGIFTLLFCFACEAQETHGKSSTLREEPRTARPSSKDAAVKLPEKPVDLSEVDLGFQGGYPLTFSGEYKVYFRNLLLEIEKQVGSSNDLDGELKAEFDSLFKFLHKIAKSDDQIGPMYDFKGYSVLGLDNSTEIYFANLFCLQDVVARLETLLGKAKYAELSKKLASAKTTFAQVLASKHTRYFDKVKNRREDLAKFKSWVSATNNVYISGK